MNGHKYFSPSSVAKSTPFDNATNGFAAKNVQAAIEEVQSTLSSPTTDQSYYVSKDGSDTIGNGSITNPYLTIAKALTVITDASPTKRYTIFVGPGDYNENLVLKANVFVKGAGPLATKITGTTLNINDTTWNVTSQDNRSGFQDISVNPTCTFDFSAQANNTDGKLYFYNIRTSGAWTCTANTQITQIIMQDSQIFGAMTFNGCNTFIASTTVQGGVMTLNSAATSGQGPGTLTLVGGRTASNVVANWTSNGALTVNLCQWFFALASTLSVTGASCTVNADVSSLPVVANRTQASSAIINRTSLPDMGMFGDASDGDVSLSSGTTNLTRTMYYNNLTLSSTAIVNTNGYKIYVRNTLALSGTSAISNDGSNAGSASGNTAGTAGAGAPGVEVGAGADGTAGVTQMNNSSSPATIIGYGNSGGKGGDGGANGGGTSGGTGAAGGVLTYRQERVVRHDHFTGNLLKLGGNGGAGGAGGQPSLLATAGAGGGGGGGGGVVIIFAARLNSTSSVGITARGGIGGAGGNAVSGNSGGGAGGGGGGGGQIYIVVQTLTALGTLNVNGGNGGANGLKTGTGINGQTGTAGSTGRTTVFNMVRDAWTVT